MNNNGDIEAYIVSSVKNAETIGDGEKKFVLLKVDGKYSSNEMRTQLKKLEIDKIIKIDSEVNPRTYTEEIEYIHEIRDPNINTPTISTHVPHIFKLQIINEKELNKLTDNKTKRKDEVNNFLYRDEEGNFYIQGRKLKISKGTDHYYLLEMFSEISDDYGYVENSEIIKFLNSKDVSIKKKDGTKQKINKNNLYKKVVNAVGALMKSSSNRVKKDFIQPEKEGREVIGWRIKK